MTFFDRYKIVVIIISIIIVVVVFFFLKISEDKEEIIKYPVLNSSEKVQGVVVDKQKIIRGYQTRVILNNGQRHNINNSENYNYTRNSRLCDFLIEGDSIYKQNNSDTLFIYRKEKEYVYLIGGIID